MRGGRRLCRRYDRAVEALGRLRDEFAAIERAALEHAHRAGFDPRDYDYTPERADVAEVYGDAAEVATALGAVLADR